MREGRGEQSPLPFFRAAREPCPANMCPDDGFDDANALDDCGCPDWYHITIHANENPASLVIYEVEGYLTGGNLQMHSSLD